jgi:sigma-B regulation protein RsbU (phosphoserine phosphatase)
MVLACLDASSGQLVWANAGHSPGCIVDSDGIVSASLGSTGLPLGMFPDRCYASQDVMLEPGELAVLFTDGVLESESPDGIEFGAERVHDVAVGCRQDGAEEIVERLYHAARDFTQGGKQTDDIAVVVCKRDRVS